MELDYFKDTLFDLINESPDLDLHEIAWNEKQNLLVAKMNDGSAFAVQVKPAAELSISFRFATTALNSVVSVIVSTLLYMAVRPALEKAHLLPKVK